jgi:TPR repeat protein
MAAAASTPQPEAGRQEVRRSTLTPLPASSIEALIKRADSMAALGDISAARLLYGRAATAGNGQAMLALGRTHDPLFLADIGARGMPGDVATAVGWYRRALALGVTEAQELLARHGIRSGE